MMISRLCDECCGDRACFTNVGVNNGLSTSDADRLCPVLVELVLALSVSGTIAMIDSMHLYDSTLTCRLAVNYGTGWTDGRMQETDRQRDIYRVFL